MSNIRKKWLHKIHLMADEISREPHCGQANEITYDYDGANMRVRSTKAGVPTYYLYGSNGSLLSEMTPNVNTKDYIYLHGKQIAVHQNTLP